MRRAFGLSLLLTASLVACSGDDDAGGGTTTTAAAPTTAAETNTTAEASATTIALRGDGLGVVDLGATPDVAIAAVTAELGAPTLDTGWEPSFSSYGTCPGDRIRAVEWDGLVLLHTDGDTAVGTGEHLFSWRVTGAPPALATATGLGFGAVASDAEELYPGAVEVVPPEEPFPGFLAIEAEGGLITAFLGEADEITNLEAGVGCGE
ncbi:MAG: hypothetical protein ABIX10_07020 [Acidimicrobiales bacterium]